MATANEDIIVPSGDDSVAAIGSMLPRVNLRVAISMPTCMMDNDGNTPSTSSENANCWSADARGYN